MDIHCDHLVQDADVTTRCLGPVCCSKGNAEEAVSIQEEVFELVIVVAEVVVKTVQV